MFILRNSFSLIMSLTKRDIEARYKNSMLGLTWSIVFPLFMLGIYSFVFGFVFKSKWGGDNADVNYSLIMFIGLIVHSFFADCLGRATTLIQSNANYVKKVIFPLESLCWVALLSSLFQFLIASIVLFGFLLFDGNQIYGTILLVPVLLFPFIMLAYSFILLLSSLSVYIRDITQMISIVISVLLFMSPVFYSVEAVPEKYQWMLYVNPLTYIIDSMRKLIIFGEYFSFTQYFLYTLISFLIYMIALKWFKKLKGGFSDVL